MDLDRLFLKFDIDYKVQRLTNFSFSFDPDSTLFCPQIRTTGPDNWLKISSTFSTNSLRFDFGTALDNH